MSDSWTREEVEATVADYFHMLARELAGQNYNKAEHRRRLQQLLNNRSEGAIERKRMNISAVLIELGCPNIPGYKPLGNYQSLLYDVVESRIKTDEALDRAALAAAEQPAVVPVRSEFKGVVEEPPALALRATERAPRTPRSVQRDYLGREARNASLGLAGEEFVVAFERWRLINSSRDKLADKVEHVSKSQGDGLGYDVLSFDVDGRERLIEVKTTAFAKETPFFVTRTEVEVSRERKDLFYLYRLFEFRRNARLFTLHGAIDARCHLDPFSYQARFS